MNIIDQNKLTVGQARYWLAKARELEGKVDVVDPWRLPMRELKARGITGRVYRASTEGSWGKSSTIATL